MQKAVNLHKYRLDVIKNDRRSSWNPIQFFVNMLFKEMNDEGWVHYDTINVDDDYLMFFEKDDTVNLRKG